MAEKAMIAPAFREEGWRPDSTSIHVIGSGEVAAGKPRIKIRAKSAEEALRFVDQLKKFITREDKHCPYCSALAVSLTKSDALAPVLIEPCGCTLWEGEKPESWS